MNYAAIWHEATQRYCYALAPGRFLFRLQVAKGDMRRVVLHTQDKYLSLKLKDTRKATPMRWVACDGLRDYYEAELTFQVVCLRYCFELEDYTGVRVFYGNGGFTDTIPGDIERMFDCPQTLREQEQFVTPTWAENRVVYQIFPSRFATHRPVPEKTWYQAPIGPRANLGGSLQGILQKLDHIKNLGADVIYLTPIFRSNSSHKYDTIDYYQIDPDFGTEDDLRRLVEKAHSMDMRVMLDGVFNHTAPEFFAFADVKAKKADSTYKDWYYVKNFPVRAFPGLPNYKCFGYFGGMPKVNLAQPDAAAYFTGVALYWLEKTGADGWRLDVADEISHIFWRQFRPAVKARFPEALIVGEVWHHAPDFLQGDEWDSVMNYPFYRAVQDFAAHGTITATQFLGAMGFQRGNTHTAVYPLLWNLIGSHDTARILHLCGGDHTRHKLAAAMQLLWPGMPMIYYGDEVGMTGGRDPDCRRGMLWDPARQDADTFAWYQKLIRLRKTLPALTKGELTAEQALDDMALVWFTRRYNGQEVTLVFHAQADAIRPPLPAALLGKTDALTGKPFDGIVPGCAAMVLV